jgi:ABC-2 type transport system ATP-binding protein
MNDATIATHSLTRRYGALTALREVKLTVEPGSVYSLVGPNGAGKTTLIQLLMNLQPATSGTAEVLGLPTDEIRGAALNRIGYVSESQELPEWMTVGALLDYLRRSIQRGTASWSSSCCATLRCHPVAS